MAVWQAQLNFRHFWDWFGSDIHIYVSAKNFVQLRKVAIQYGYDPVVMFYKEGAAPLCPSKEDARRNIDWFVSNNALAVTQTTSIAREHPYPRPLDGVREIIRNFTAPGARILEPFAGSGTTLLAARLEGRTAVGIEIDPVYADIARRRIAEHTAPVSDAF